MLVVDGKLHSSHWLAVAVCLCLSAGARAAEDAVGDTPAQKVTTIETKVVEISALRARALRENQPVKLSCIEEKLRRTRESLAVARAEQKKWPAIEGSRAARRDSLEKLRLHELYALAYAQEARACTDAQVVGVKLEIKIEGVPQATPGADPVRPPSFERPPLASPY